MVPGCEEEDEDPNKVFGSALTAALDMMAFQNDLNLPQNGLPAAPSPVAPTAPAAPVANHVKPANSTAKPANPQANALANGPVKAPDKPPSYAKATTETGPAPPANIPSTSVPPTTGHLIPLRTEDPLRELVLRAEYATTPPNELTELARRAADTVCNK